MASLTTYEDLYNHQANLVLSLSITGWLGVTPNFWPLIGCRVLTAFGIFMTGVEKKLGKTFLLTTYLLQVMMCITCISDGKYLQAMNCFGMLGIGMPDLFCMSAKRMTYQRAQAVVFFFATYGALCVYKLHNLDHAV